MNKDKTDNENQGVPMFDIDDNGRVDLTLWKMDTGFLLTDNDRKKEHSISNMEDLQASLDLLVESIKTKVRHLMNDKSKFEFVDIAFILQEGETEADQYDLGEPQLPETMEINPEQLADIINSIYDEGPLQNFPARGGGRNVRTVSAENIMAAMNNPRNIIKLRTRLGNQDGKKIRSSDTANIHERKKKFHSDKTKNRDNQGKDQKKDGGKSEPSKIS